MLLEGVYLANKTGEMLLNFLLLQCGKLMLCHKNHKFFCKNFRKNDFSLGQWSISLSQWSIAFG